MTAPNDLAAAVVGVRVFATDPPETPDERIADSTAYLRLLFDCRTDSVWWGRAACLEIDRLQRAVDDKAAEEAA